MKINANLLKVGHIIRHNDRLLQVLNTNIIKPGKGGAYIQVEMRDLKSGSKTNERWRTSDDIEKISVSELLTTFLYIQNDQIMLMNNENFEQFSVNTSIVGQKVNLLEDGMQLTAEIIDDEVINLYLPKQIKVEIKDADAVVKGQTASSSFKNAITTNEIKILVPQHIKNGDKVILNSENLEYIEKAKD